MDMSLAWASRSLIDPYSPEMLAVVRSAVRRNRALGLTGALYFDESKFIQILEGPRNNLDAVFRRIEEDWRHTDVTVLDQQPIDRRLFSASEMRFVDGVRQRATVHALDFDAILAMHPGQRREMMLAVLRA